MIVTGMPTAHLPAPRIFRATQRRPPCTPLSTRSATASGVDHLIVDGLRRHELCQIPLLYSSKRDFGTVGRHPVARQRFAWPMFPDTAFKTTIHAVAVSEMYAIAVSKMPAADTTVREGPSDKHAAAPLEAVAAGGMVVPVRELMQVCRPGLHPMWPGPTLWNAARNWPYTHRQLPYKLAPGRQHATLNGSQ